MENILINTGCETQLYDNRLIISKIKLVVKLLEDGKITEDEAEQLLDLKKNNISSTSFTFNLKDDEPSFYYDTCQCNPNNGGNGVCRCTMDRTGYGGIKLYNA